MLITAEYICLVHFCLPWQNAILLCQNYTRIRIYACWYFWLLGISWRAIYLKLLTI